MVYSNFKVYGPYKRKDGREHVILINGEIRKTVSYPKFLVEIYMDRYLEESETVDHIDGDYTNNELGNLRVLDRSKHISADVKRYATQKFCCPECSIEFNLEGRKLHDAIWNRRKGRCGPFCSRSCAGRYGQRVQMGEPKLPVQSVVPSYTTNKLTESLQEETLEVDDPNSGKP